MRGVSLLVLALGAWLLALPSSAQTGDSPAEVAPSPTDAAPATTVEATATPSPEAPAEASASGAPASQAARVPKVAIVVAGDPDPAALAAAASLEQVLAQDGRVTMPSDPAMRDALRGQGHDDGLDEVRAERRRLGLGEARELGALATLGEVASADLILVVRAGHGAVRGTAFDVQRRAFYDGELALEPIDVDAAARFVFRRASRATRPLAPGEREAIPAEAAPTASVDPSTAVPPEAVAADPATGEHQPDFFEQYWPYFAAGALLIGAVVFIVFATQSNSTPPPVLRFEAGGGS